MLWTVSAEFDGYSCNNTSQSSTKWQQIYADIIEIFGMSFWSSEAVRPGKTLQFKNMSNNEF